jgi:hypothetical protein
MKENTSEIKAFLTPKDIAVRWSWHTESIRRKIRRREITSVIIGRRLLIPIAEVERIEASGTVNARN